MTAAQTDEGTRFSRTAIQAILSFWIGVGGMISHPDPKEGPLNTKAKRQPRNVFLRPFADALDGAPQQTSCEESLVRLLSFTMGSAIESLHCQSHYWHGGDMNQPRFDT